MKKILIVNNNLDVGGIQKSLVNLLCEIHNEYDIYEWKLEEYRSIELEACTYVGETQLAWVSVTYS